MLHYATQCYKEIKSILEFKISAFSFPRFRVETNENSKTRKEKRGNQIFHLFALCSQVKREGSATLPDSSLNE